MIKRTAITIACLLMLWIIGLFTIPHGRLTIFLYEFDPKYRAEGYKKQDAYDYADDKCRHLNLESEESVPCWQAAVNEYMSR